MAYGGCIARLLIDHRSSIPPSPSVTSPTSSLHSSNTTKRHTRFSVNLHPSWTSFKLSRRCVDISLMISSVSRPLRCRFALCLMLVFSKSTATPTDRFVV